MDYSPLGSSVHGILHARILEWVAIPFSRGSSPPSDWTQVTWVAGGFFTIWEISDSWCVAETTTILLSNYFAKQNKTTTTAKVKLKKKKPKVDVHLPQHCVLWVVSWEAIWSHLMGVLGANLQGWTSRDVKRGLQQPELSSWQTGFLVTVVPKYKSQPVNLSICRSKTLALVGQGALCPVLPHFGLQVASLPALEPGMPPHPEGKLIHSPAYCWVYPPGHTGPRSLVCTLGKLNRSTPSNPEPGQWLCPEENQDGDLSCHVTWFSVLSDLRHQTMSLAALKPIWLPCPHWKADSQLCPCRMPPPAPPDQETWPKHLGSCRARQHLSWLTNHFTVKPVTLSVQGAQAMILPDSVRGHTLTETTHLGQAPY